MVAPGESIAEQVDVAPVTSQLQDAAVPPAARRIAVPFAIARDDPVRAIPVPRRSLPPRLHRERRAARRTIVHLTAEYRRYAYTGGLAEAVAGLASSQVRAGERVVVFVPLYDSVREVATDLVALAPPQPLVIGNRTEAVSFFREATRKYGPRVIFVDVPGCFARAGIYGDSGQEYPDNHLRFAFFSLAALHGIRRFVRGPVLLHAHDWHAALAPIYMRTLPALARRFASTPVVMSVHNAGYQGHFPPGVMEDLALPWELYTVERLEWYGRLNMLKGGLKFCDAVVTVSPAHAAELRTAEGGFGLHDTFNELGARFTGICNGIDQRDWDPATDRQIAANYSSADLSGKAVCKEAAQRAFGLPCRPDVPLLGMSSRLVGQKGFDILLQSARLRSVDVQLVVLGQGELRYHDAVSALAATHPERIACEFGFTDHLEHQLMAGADAVLMPSLYEPCGLTQMHAQRYGAPVIGRRVGGIADTVVDNDTGFLFDAYNALALDEALDRALERFADRPAWRSMMQRAMARDFGWDRSMMDYADVYRGAERAVQAPG